MTNLSLEGANFVLGVRYSAHLNLQILQLREDNISKATSDIHAQSYFWDEMEILYLAWAREKRPGLYPKIISLPRVIFSFGDPFEIAKQSN